MATFYSKMSNYYQLKLEVTQKSQDVANNKTTLDWVLTLNMSHGYYFYDHQCTTLVKIGGVTVHSSDKRRSFSSATPTVLERGTVTVPHNSDGTLSAGIYANFDVARSSYTPQIPLVIDSSMPISTIPRASTPTLDKSSVNYGDPVTISTNRKSDAFTHTLKATWNGKTETVKTGITTGFTWYVPKEYMNRIPNNTSSTGTLTLETYNGSTLIGKKTANLKAIVPSSIKPSITSLAVSEAAQGLEAKFGDYIQSKSQLLIKAGASGTYGSSIKSYQIIANGQTFGSASATTGYIRNSGSNKITVNVTDSRGRTQSRSTTVDVLAYTSPRINVFDVYRCGPSGAAQANGDYARANYKGSVTSLNGKNDKEYTIKYKPKSETAWTSLDLDNSSYTPDLYKVISGINTTKSYDFRLEISDYFGTAALNVSIGTAAVFMDWKPGGRAIAFGKFAEKEDAVDTAWDYYSDRNPVDLQTQIDRLQQNVETVQVINLPITSLVTKWDPNFTGPQAIRQANGIVHLRGVLKLTGSFTNGDVIAILPEGFRPPIRDIFPAGIPGQVGRLDIESSGKIHLLVASPDVLNWFYISGVSFSTV